MADNGKITLQDLALFEAEWRHKALTELRDEAEAHDQRVLRSVIAQGGNGIDRRVKYLEAIKTATGNIEEIEQAFEGYFARRR